MELESRKEEFIRLEDFEISDTKFEEIRINDKRIIARGEQTRFELLISFIGGSWMKSWPRFGDKVLGAGLLTVLFGTWLSTIGLIGLPFLGGGIAAIILAIFAKHEAIVIYCSGQKFKIEGPSEFIEDVWDAIAGAQRRKDL